RFERQTDLERSVACASAAAAASCSCAAGPGTITCGTSTRIGSGGVCRCGGATTRACGARTAALRSAGRTASAPTASPRSARPAGAAAADVVIVRRRQIAEHHALAVDAHLDLLVLGRTAILRSEVHLQQRELEEVFAINREVVADEDSTAGTDGERF